MARTCRRRTDRARRRATARRRRSPRSAPACRRARGSPTISPRSNAHLDGSDGGSAQLRQAARRLERIAGEHPLLGRSARRARPRDDRGSARPRTGSPPPAMRSPSIRRGSTRSRPGCSSCARIARKHRIEPDALARARPPNWPSGCRGSRPAAPGSPSSKRAVAEARAAYEDAAADASARSANSPPRRLDTAVAGELAPLQAGGRALPHRRRAARRGAVERRRPRPRRIRDLDQPRRAVRARWSRSPAAASCRASSSRSRWRWPRKAAPRR